MSDFCAGYGGKVACSENSMVWKGVGPGVIEEGFERIRCFAVVQSTNATLSEFCNPLVIPDLNQNENVKANEQRHDFAKRTNSSSQVLTTNLPYTGKMG
jgi:hypothetical protein